MRARFIGFALFLSVAEIAASWWLWGKAPTDTIRVWYSGFWAFEVGRLYSWVPLFMFLLGLWGVGWYGLWRHGHPITRWLFAAALAVGLEVVTTALYWRSAEASNLRNLFQSIWYWQRIPLASDMGWPSFKGYLWAHLLPWSVVVVIGTALWVLFEKRAGWRRPPS